MADPKYPHVHLRKGALYGWCHRCSAEERHKALEKSIRADGPGVTVKRLNRIAVLDKNRDPELTEVAQRDMRWVQREYE